MDGMLIDLSVCMARIAINSTLVAGSITIQATRLGATENYIAIDTVCKNRPNVMDCGVLSGVLT